MNLFTVKFIDMNHNKSLIIQTYCFISSLSSYYWGCYSDFLLELPFSSALFEISEFYPLTWALFNNSESYPLTSTLFKCSDFYSLTSATC